MTELQKNLFAMADPKYKEFSAKLTPGKDKEKIIGIRVPVLRKFAADFEKTPECAQFLKTLPHEYFEEDMLHSILITRMKDFQHCLDEIDRFLPYADCWEVTDILSPKVFAKHTNELLPKIHQWIQSSLPFTCRFGIEILMNFYLDKFFKPEYLELPASVRSEEYYVNMMIAWFFATALTKQWDSTIPFIEQNRLALWPHNKTIQKARESFRITDAQKEYLLKFKRNA